MHRMLKIVPSLCTGCRQCELACSWVQTGTFQPSRSLIRVHVFDEEASFAPYTCLQCHEAWCLTACPVNAITVDESTGAKLVIDSLCIDCHLCTLACPFGTVFTLPAPSASDGSSSGSSSNGPAGGRASKCNLCHGQPACVASCPTDAILFEATETHGPWFSSWADDVQSSRLAAVEDTGNGGNA